VASLQNRSRFVVSVKNNGALSQEFPFDQAAEARGYLLQLRQRGYKPALAQREDHILVRFRSRGYPDLTCTFTSMDEAETFERQVRAERKRGLVVDYSKSAGTTVAELIRKYLLEEIPRMKNGTTYAYVLQGMLDDSEGLLERQVAERDRQLAERGRTDIVIKAMRTPMGSLEWLHKPFINVVPTDIEDWMRSRESDVKPGTIWRQYEQLRAIINLAIKTWRYPVHQSPCEGVRHLDFCNERDRRLAGDEEDRLLAAARAGP
jgi:hypothetical protein